MFNKLREQTGQFLVTAIISLIIIGFMFTGYQSFQSSPDTVAQVGDIKINYREYRQVLDRQLEFFSYQFGGKPLSSKQIEQFRLKPRALESVVTQKLMVKLADELGAVASKDEIVSRIKEMPVFQTDKQFDVTKYKGLLQANRLSPNEFENSIAQEVKLNKVQNILSSVPISQNFLNSVKNLSEQERLFNAVTIDTNKLQKYIDVSKKEIKDYLEDEKNNQRVESYFNSKREQKYDQKEKVQASHILITSKGDKKDESLKKAREIRKKLTTKNFAKLANKHSEDPGNKAKKGGALGWFERGRMVPEFENVAFTLKPGTISEPIKTNYGHHIIYVTNKKAKKIAELEDHREDIAKEFIQQDSKEKLDGLKSDLSIKIKKALKSNNQKKLTQLKSKYSLNLINDGSISVYKGSKQLNGLTQNQIHKVFNLNNEEIFEFKDGFRLTFIRTPKKPVNNKIDESKVKTELKSLFSKKFNEDSIQVVRKIYPPKSYPGRL